MNVHEETGHEEKERQHGKFNIDTVYFFIQ